MTKQIEEEPLEDEEQEDEQDDDQEDEEEEDQPDAQATEISPMLFAAVSGTVADTLGIPWAFCVLQFSLVVPSGQKPIDLTTGLVIPNPAPITADNLGRFVINLQQNTMVVPQSQWTVTIFPFISPVQGQQLTPFLVAGPVSLTAQIAAQLRPFDIGPPLILPTSHDADIGRSTDTASVYYDVEAPGLYVRDPAADAYVKIGPGAAPPAQVYPGAGLAVSTGAAWATSLPTASIPPVFLDNTATAAGHPRIVTGAIALAAGIANVTFAQPFLAGSFPSVLLSIIGAEAAGSTAVPTVWLFSITNVSFSVHASSLTSTDTLRWVAIGTT